MHEGRTQLRALWLAVVIVLAGSCGVLASSGTVAAAELTVANDGSGDYTSIQNAVDAASPGDTIRVENGTYGESVVVNTSDLRIVGAPTADRGAGAGAPVLDNSSGDSRNGFNAAFFVEAGADNVSIEGFDIRNYDYGVLVDAANLTGGGDGTISSVTVTSNSFQDVAFTGFAVAEGQGSTLSEFKFSNNVVRSGAGPSVWALNLGTVDGVVLTDNDIQRSSEGNGISIYARELDSPSLGLDASPAGTETARDVLIANNDVDIGVQSGKRDTVQLVFHNDSLGQNVTVRNNTLSNTSTGFLLEGNGTYDDVDLLGNHITHTNNVVKTRPADGDEEGPTDVTGVTFAENYVGESVTSGFVHPDSAEGVLNASWNYWNAPDGPSGEGYDGSGVSVSDNVTVTPYYTDAEMTSLSVANKDTGNHYPTIQAAVDNASAGDRLVASGGTYAESVTVDVENLTLASAGDRTSTINSTDGPVLQVAAPNVTVDGFTVSGATGTNEQGQGVDVTGDSTDTDGVVLRNLTVVDNDDRGVVVDYTDNATLENVVVRENYDLDETGDTPEDGWESTDDADGITLWYTNDSRLETVTAVDNGDNGIYVNGNDNVLRNVTAINNGDDGLDISNERVAGGAAVDGVTVIDNRAQGVEIEGNDDGTTVEIANASVAGSPVGLAVAGSNDGTIFLNDSRFADNPIHIQSGGSGIRTNPNLSFDAVAASSTGGTVIYGHLQPAIDATPADGLVRAAGGPFNETVTVDTDGLRLRSMGDVGTGQFAEGPPTINGELDVSAPGVTVEGIHVTRMDTVTAATASNPHGILVTANDTTLRNVTVADVSVDSSMGGVTYDAIHVFGGDPPVTNVTVVNSTVRTLRNDGGTQWPNYRGLTGIKLQAGLENVSVEGNDLSGLHSAGWSWGVVLTPSSSADGVPANVSITENEIKRINDGSEFDVLADATAAPYPGTNVGIDGSDGLGFANAAAVTLHRNVLAGSPLVLNNKDPDAELNASRNYWGSPLGPASEPSADRPAAVGNLSACSYYASEDLIALREPGSTISMTLSADQSTVTAGTEVTFTLRESTTGEPVPGRVTVAGTTSPIGPDGQLTVRLPDAGTVEATGTHESTGCNEFEADTATVTVESSQVGGGGGGGNTDDGAVTTPTPTATPTVTPTPTTTDTVTPTATPTASATATTDDAGGAASPPPNGTEAPPAEPGGFQARALAVVLLFVGSVAVGLGVLRTRDVI